METTAAVVSKKGSNFELTKVMLKQPKSDEVLVKIVVPSIIYP